MKVGIEACHGFLADLDYQDFSTSFQRAKDFGFEGLYYKSPQYLTTSLDLGVLKEARALADDLSLYLEFGIGRVNPYNTSEAAQVWLLADGNYRAALEMIIAAAAEIGCHELTGVTAGWKGNHKGYFCFDRFRTDVDWSEQLQATENFLKRLAPALRHHGSRINLETHEEITSFEIVRIIECVGSDVLGVTFDTANVLSRGEDPLAVAQRVAPYCHQSHAKDAILFSSPTGMVRQIRPCGSGVVNWKAMLPILATENPELNLTIEDHKGYMPIDFHCEAWRQAHPDLNLAEMSELFRLARICDQRLAAGEIDAVEAYEGIPYEEQMDQRLRSSLDFLKNLLQELSLHRR